MLLGFLFFLGLLVVWEWVLGAVLKKASSSNPLYWSVLLGYVAFYSILLWVMVIRS